jgi:hypothetical protein
MKQVLHLLIVNSESRQAQAARFGTRWLLPTIACAERTRAGPLAARWCAERGLSGDVAGQWLGRVNDDSVDWLIAIAAAPLQPALTALDWIDLDSVASGPSVVEYQSWSVARCLERAERPAVCGPFGTLEWPAKTREWVTASLGSTASAWMPYRISAHEVVAGVETARGRVFFKGLSGPRSAEALLTRTLASLAPESFAPTLALEHRDDGSVWWLTGECPGGTSHDTALVATALARIQQQLMPRLHDLANLTTADLEGAARWTRTGFSHPEHLDAICDAVDYVSRAGLPSTWIPMDLDSSNVLVQAEAVRFIDVDDSFVGPAPLAAAAFAGRCPAYEHAWWPSLRGLDWGRLRMAARTFQSWRGWQRLECNVARGEVHVDRDRAAARVRKRLAAALYSR